MTTIIIAGNFPNGFDLNGTTDALENPVLITGTIDVGTSGLSAALQGETIFAWDVTNQGLIQGGTVDGIDLLLGGTVTNDASAEVSGLSAIKILGTAGIVVNGGTLDASSNGAGIYLLEGGDATNQVGAHIQSGLDGVTARGSAAAVVTNAGIINAGTSLGAAVDLFAGGDVTNAAGGTLTGGFGISIAGAATGSVSNSGVITGAAQVGVLLTGGTVTNQQGGTISGNYGVSIEDAAGTVTNGGVITGAAQPGVFLNGGSVTNLAGGTISGDWGVFVGPGTLFGAAGTVITSGTIIGTNGTAVSLPSGFADLLVDNPGAVFTGVADGGNVTGGSTAVSMLELGAASLQGTLSGLGTNFVDFGRVLIDVGASWQLTGTNTIAAGVSLVDQGTLLLNAATLADDGAETIGAAASLAASATVTGGGVWSGGSTLVDGDAGSGSLLINGQGSVAVATAVLGASVGGTGSLDVTGTGSGFSTTASLTVGQAARGQLTVENQASVQVGGVTDIGMTTGGSGEVTVTGTQSVLAGTGQFTVGDSGLGGLSIDAGGTVTGAAGATIANTACRLRIVGQRHRRRLELAGYRRVGRRRRRVRSVVGVAERHRHRRVAGRRGGGGRRRGDFRLRHRCLAFRHRGFDRRRPILRQPEHRQRRLRLHRQR